MQRPAHRNLSLGLVNLQQKLKLHQGFSRPFEKLWEAQTVHYNYTLTIHISSSTPSACGELGYEKEKVIEKGKGRRE